jgi:hypothetical protein
MRRPVVPLAVPLLTAALVLGACSDTSGSGTDGQAAPGGALEIPHDTGTLTLEGPATRIVTTSDETTELVVALGLQPVGAGSTRVDPLVEDPFAGYYIDSDRLGDPQFLGAASWSSRRSPRWNPTWSSTGPTTRSTSASPGSHPPRCTT